MGGTDLRGWFPTGGRSREEKCRRQPTRGPSCSSPASDHRPPPGLCLCPRIPGFCGLIRESREPRAEAGPPGGLLPVAHHDFTAESRGSVAEGGPGEGESDGSDSTSGRDGASRTFPTQKLSCGGGYLVRETVEVTYGLESGLFSSAGVMSSRGKGLPPPARLRPAQLAPTRPSPVAGSPSRGASASRVPYT
jgi:hypothetical protein